MLIWSLKCLLSMLRGMLGCVKSENPWGEGKYKHIFSSSLSDLMKSTEVDESLSTTSTDVLFQRIPTNFKKCYDRYRQTLEGKDYCEYTQARNQAKWACKKAIRDFEIAN